MVVVIRGCGRRRRLVRRRCNDTYVAYSYIFFLSVIACISLNQVTRKTVIHKYLLHMSCVGV